MARLSGIPVQYGSEEKLAQLANIQSLLKGSRAENKVEVWKGGETNAFRVKMKIRTQKLKKLKLEWAEARNNKMPSVELKNRWTKYINELDVMARMRRAQAEQEDEETNRILEQLARNNSRLWWKTYRNEKQREKLSSEQQEIVEKGLKEVGAGMFQHDAERV